jgi:hypothetical protein
MNLKVAHLVSVQFGIFIGIVCCLVFSRSEYFRPRATAERRAPVTERAGAVESLSQSEDQTADVGDGADAELAELVTDQTAPALPNEYSPEAVERYRAEATRLYYEQIAPRRNPSGNPATTQVAAVAPAYTEAEEPAIDQANDPAPETVAYVQPTQVIVYPQPVQFVVFSQPRRLANRCRPASPPGALASNPHQRRNGGGTHLSGSTAFERPTSPSSALPRPPGSLGVAHHRNTGAPSCPPTQGFNPRGTR